MSLFREAETPRGSYWRHVNWDQFTDESHSFEYVNADEPKAGFQKAKVLKITDVKPGQEFPTAKHGQGQLFRMQVWPKGFTPQRRRHIQTELQTAIDVDDYAEEGLGEESTAASKQQVKAQAMNAVARSTIPTKDINRLNHTKIILGEEPEGGGVGGYMDANVFPPEIHVSRSPQKDIQDLKLDSLLIHEIGHSTDNDTNPENFINSYRSANYDAIGQIDHVKEGVAMGYQLAHFRATRDQRRRGFRLMREARMPLRMGYESQGFEDDGTGDNRGIDPQYSFRRARLTTYRQEQGLTPHPLQEQRSDAPYYRQNKLPGI